MSESVIPNANFGRVRDLEAQLAERAATLTGLRKRIHFIEHHNQWFERCESGWCNPSPDCNPAVGYESGKLPGTTYEEQSATIERLTASLREAYELRRIVLTRAMQLESEASHVEAMRSYVKLFDAALNPQEQP